MSDTFVPDGVHLVGSVPFASADEVFRRVPDVLGPHLRRLPDGETGERSEWIRWQYGILAACPGLEPAEPEEGALPTPRLRLAPGSQADSLQLGALGYADAAVASYAVFDRLRHEGVVPAGVRFQVSLPTPLAPVLAYIRSEMQGAFWPVYEARLLEELREICDQIPHEALAIQWDTAVEFAVLEGVMPTSLTDLERNIVDQLVRIGDAVPADIDLGFHLCYGDAGHRHFVEPKDTERLTTVANAVVGRLRRPVQWIHLPVPRERGDAGYFKPLLNLDLPSATELYLGLVHLTDGLEGSRHRIDAARSVVESFGVATECGWGRRDPNTLADLLHLHRQLVTRDHS